MFLEVNENRITAMMIMSSFGLGLLMFLVCWPHFIPGAILGAAVTVAGWSLPKTLVQSMYERRCGRVVDQMIDGLTIMSNGVRAGKSIQQSMERVTEGMNGPLAKEFEVILSEVRLGSSVEEALTKFGERVPRPDVQMFVTSINVLKETGGNLSETFSTIVTVIRERQKIEKKIEAMTAQGLMQGMIITAVPFILLLVFFLIDPNYIAPLFSTVVGVIALIIVVTLQIIGGLMIRKIVTIKV
jgi:tight adherence protein B